MFRWRELSGKKPHLWRWRIALWRWEMSWFRRKFVLPIGQWNIRLLSFSSHNLLWRSSVFSLFYCLRRWANLLFLSTNWWIRCCPSGYVCDPGGWRCLTHLLAELFTVENLFELVCPAHRKKSSISSIPVEAASELLLSSSRSRCFSGEAHRPSQSDRLKKYLFVSLRRSFDIYFIDVDSTNYHPTTVSPKWIKFVIIFSITENLSFRFVLATIGWA